MTDTTKRRGSRAAHEDEDENAPKGIESVEPDEGGASHPVKVSLVSPFEGHRFRVPYADDPDDALVIDAQGVLVERDAVEAIQEAAERSGVTVKVEEQ